MAFSKNIKNSCGGSFPLACNSPSQKTQPENQPEPCNGKFPATPSAGDAPATPLSVIAGCASNSPAAALRCAEISSKKLRPLLLRCFPEDGETYWNAFFKNFFPLGQAFGIEKNNELVSALMLFPKTLVFGKKEYRAGLLSCICTLPECRGKDYAKKVIELAKESARKENYDLLYLSPENPKVYESSGFVPFAWTTYFSSLQALLPIIKSGVYKSLQTPLVIAGEAKQFQMRLQKAQLSQAPILLSLYSRYAQNKNGYSARDADFYERLFSVYEFYLVFLQPKRSLPHCEQLQMAEQATTVGYIACDSPDHPVEICLPTLPTAFDDANELEGFSLSQQKAISAMIFPFRKIPYLHSPSNFNWDEFL